VRALLQQGVKQVDIALRLNISPQAVNAIKRRMLIADAKKQKRLVKAVRTGPHEWVIPVRKRASDWPEVQQIMRRLRKERRAKQRED
jgi:hypothetical protein